MKKSRKAFVLMPFKQPYNSYYSTILKPALEAASFKVSRADELFAPCPVVMDIMKSIEEADLILCEMSGRNPNVFYELGLAHAIGKPAILLSQRKEDIPFDVQHIRRILYDCTIQGWEDQLREAILLAVQTLDDPINIWPPPMGDSRARMIGFQEFGKERRDITTLQQCLDIVQHQLDYLGVIPMVHIPEAELIAKLPGKIQEGCTFRFIMLDPNSPYAKDRIQRGGAYTQDYMKHIARLLLNIKKELGCKGNNLRLRLYNEYPVWCIGIIDQHTSFLSFYGDGKAGLDNPAVLIESGPNSFYEACKVYFEELWEHSTELVSAKMLESSLGQTGDGLRDFLWRPMIGYLGDQAEEIKYFDNWDEYYNLATQRLNAVNRRIDITNFYTFSPETTQLRSRLEWFDSIKRFIERKTHITVRRILSIPRKDKLVWLENVLNELEQSYNFHSRCYEPPPLVPHLTFIMFDEREVFIGGYEEPGEKDERLRISSLPACQLFSLYYEKLWRRANIILKDERGVRRANLDAIRRRLEEEDGGRSG